jgi:hypothetical protein
MQRAALLAVRRDGAAGQVVTAVPQDVSAVSSHVSVEVAGGVSFRLGKSRGGDSSKVGGMVGAPSVPKVCP